MTWILKICAFFVFTLVSVNQVLIAQENSFWENDATKIQTEHITIDFSSTQFLNSSQNAKLSNKGVQQAEPGKPTILISRELVVPLKEVLPFLALGSRMIFEEASNQLQKIRLEIRYSSNADEWSEWALIEKDDHLTVNPYSLIGTLQYLPHNTQFIQFRISLPDSATAKMLLRSLDLSFTSPGATPQENLDQLQQKSIHIPKPSTGFLDKYPMPEYATRTDWNCPDGQKPSGIVSLTNVTHQIVHHTAASNSSSDWPAVVRSIWDYHVNTNGWSDIGYNWLIDPNGVIYQGRGWINGNNEVQGAHFCGTNSNTMGVALMGNFEEVNPTINAKHSLEELLAWKSDEKNINPTGRDYHSSSGLILYTISGHRDGCSTLCPGENLYIQLSQIRENVQQKIGLQPQNPETHNGLTLNNNYPNPFSNETTLTFSIGQPGHVNISIWDASGKMVQLISDKYYGAETYSETWNASNVASGVYFCRISYEGKISTQKMILLR